MKPRKGNQPHDEIIIKRRRKSGHGEAHGGAWKVAFADFTLAMMALFMVLWIIQPQRKADAVNADALVNPLVDGAANIFDGTSATPLDFDGSGQSGQRDAKTLSEREKQLLEARKISLKELAVLMNTLAKQLNAEANLAIEIVPQGLRILIKDDAASFMFERGGSKLNPKFLPILQRLAEGLNQVDNNIIISGHTDATQYANHSQYNNWNLSGDRALVARNVLVAQGLHAPKVLQVTAQADTTLMLPEAPEDGRNRRIELLVLTQQAEALYRQLFRQDAGRAQP